MLRGWLSFKLQDDRSIVAASRGKVTPELEHSLRDLSVDWIRVKKKM